MGIMEQNRAEQRTGQNVWEVPITWEGQNLPVLERIIAREEVQESWQNTFSSVSYHLKVASWNWEGRSKIFVDVSEFKNIESRYSHLLGKSLGGCRTFVVAKCPTWHWNGRGPMTDGRGWGFVGGVLHPAQCREISWRLLLPHSFSTIPILGGPVDQRRMQNVETSPPRHSGKFHGQQQWVPTWHHKNPSQGNQCH